MAIDTSIYSRQEQPDAGNFLQAYGQAIQARNAQAQNKLLGYQNQQAQQQLSDQQALRAAYAKNFDPTTGQVNMQGMASDLAAANAGTQIPGVIKQNMDMQAARIDQAQKAIGLQKTLSTQVIAQPTLANAMSSLDQMETVLGKGSMDSQRQQLQQMGDNPEAIKQWAAGHAMDADKLLPQFQKVDQGGTVGLGTVDPVTGQYTQTDKVNKTVSPDTVANNKTSLEVAGILGHNGKPMVIGQGSPYDSLVDDIGLGRLDVGTALSRVPVGAKAQIMAAVAQKYPGYDFTTVVAKKKAAADFTSGPQGNQMRSFATSGQHLDQLGDLVDALNNGDNQTLNKLGNAVGAWNGSTAPTNFDAAKDIVGKEVIKAIVAGGGGVGEREELQQQLSNAKTPAQLKGVIQQYRNLMQAQYDNLLAQRRAAGLPDSTLPDYTDKKAAPAAGNLPPVNAQGWTLHVDKNGNRAYVSPDGSQYQEVH